MTKEKKAMLMMILCACLWSIGGILLKWISWHPFLIAGTRSLIAALILAGYMMVAKIKLTVCKFSVGAAISLVGCFFCFTAANKLTTAANAIILQYTAPVFILIISALFLHQKIRRKEIIVVGITMAGIVLFFFDQLSAGNILGNLLAVLSGVFLGAMFMVVSLGGGEGDSIRMSGILMAHVLTALIGIPVGLPFTESFAAMEVVSLLALGIFQLGIPYVLFGLAAKNCSPLACSLIGMLEPLLNPVWVFLLDGERPGTFALVGGVIVITAVTVWCVKGESR